MSSPSSAKTRNSLLLSLPRPDGGGGCEADGGGLAFLPTPHHTMTTFPPNLNADALPPQLPLPAWARQPGRVPLDITIRPPGSKSITNRALLLAALCPGTSTLNHALFDADDAKQMLAAIAQLGAGVDQSDPTKLKITGVGGGWKIDPNTSTINLNNAGTATRFLTASALLGDGPMTITGNERMQQRPIAELAELLRQLGAGVEYLNAEGCPPIRVSPPAELVGNTITIGRTQSSQFITAMMLVGVFLEGGITILMPEGTTSASYVRMTIELLDHLGVQVQHAENLSVIKVLAGLNAFDLDVEPDASGATYWWAAGALLPKATIRVAGFGSKRKSLQGDALFPGLMEKMGCGIVERENTLACKGETKLTGIECDMSDMPDAAMSLAAVACFAWGRTVIRGVRTLRVKECDRIAALKAELGKLGVWVEDDLGGDEDVLAISPPDGGVDCSQGCEQVVFETYDDHRMAMALSLIALRRGHVVIDEPRCVEKTYPGFFGEFAKLY